MDRVEIPHGEYDDLRAAFRALTQMTYELAMDVEEARNEEPLGIGSVTASSAFDEVLGSLPDARADDFEAVRRLESRGWGYKRPSWNVEDFTNV